MNKIIVTREVLQKLFAENPEVEVEIVASAAAQIAGHLSSKVKEMAPRLDQKYLDTEKRIAGILDQQVVRLQSTAILIEPIKKVVKEAVASIHQDWVKDLLTKAVGDVALARADDLIKVRIDKAMDTISRKIEDSLSDMRKQIETYQSQNQAWIETTAEEVFLKLIKGAIKIEGITT